MRFVETAHGRMFAVTNARCSLLEALTPPPERTCEDECSENLRLSGFNDFTIKVGRASYSTLPGIAQRIADTMGGCGATMAFINVGTRSEDEDETTIFRKFAFVGLNTNCPFTVNRGAEDRSYTFERYLAYGDVNDRFAFLPAGNAQFPPQDPPKHLPQRFKIKTGMTQLVGQPVKPIVIPLVVIVE